MSSFDACARGPMTVLAVTCGLALAAAGCSGGGGGGGGTIRLDRASVEVAADYAASPPASQLVAVDFDGDAVAVTSPDGRALPDWVFVVASDSSGHRVYFSVSASDTHLAPGRREAVIRFVTARRDGSGMASADLHVYYTLRDALVLSPAQASLTANDEGGATIAVDVAHAGGEAVAWTATADAGLRLAAASGAAGERVRVTYDAAAQLLAPGAHALGVRVSAEIGGQVVSRTLPVAVDVGVHRMWAARNGVALVSVPGTSVLTARVPLVDNAGVATGTWSARSDQAWLTASVAGDSLSLQADPQGLSDGIHLATVTITSTGRGLDTPERVRVGLYTSGATPVTGLIASEAVRRDPVVDPVRPWIWVLTDPDGLHALAYNAYSGAKEADIALPSRAYHLALSTDGRVLYAGAAPLTTYRIYAYDLDAGAALPDITGGPRGTVGSDVAAFLRPSGHDVIATSEGDFYDAATGAIEPLPGSTLSTGSGWWMRPSPDQRYVYGIDLEGSPSTMVRARMRYTGSPPSLRLADEGRATTLDLPSVFMQHLAITADGLRACYPTGRNALLEKFSVVAVPAAGKPLTEVDSFLPAAEGASPEAVQLALDGRLVTLESKRVVAYAALHGAVTHTYDVPLDSAFAELVLTSDGERAVVARSTTGKTELYGYPAR